MSSQTTAVITTLYKSDSLDELELAIHSVETQEFDLTIRIYLCLDGPLPQAHEDWLAQNESRFYRVLRNEVNMGLARSLNRLIDILEDEVLVFRMDGDDIALPTRFARQKELMASDPELALIGCQAQDIDVHGTVIAKREFPTDPDILHNALYKLNPVLHPTYCIRRDILHDPSVRYPDAHLTEDLAFLVILIEKGHLISNHPEILFQWRTGANFINRRRGFKRGVTEMKWYFRALKSNGGMLSIRAAFPVARFCMRLLPPSWSKVIYQSSLRRRVLGSKVE